jgi:hypothetical protein
LLQYIQLIQEVLLNGLEQIVECGVKLRSDLLQDIKDDLKWLPDDFRMKFSSLIDSQLNPPEPKAASLISEEWSYVKPLLAPSSAPSLSSNAQKPGKVAPAFYVPPRIPQRKQPASQMSQLQKLKHEVIREKGLKVNNRPHLPGTYVKSVSVIEVDSDDEPEREHRSIKLLDSAPKAGRVINVPGSSSLKPKKPIRNLDDLYKCILEWNITDDIGKLPSNLASRKVLAVPNNFETFEDYVDVMEPLLLLECWESFIQSRDNVKSNGVNALKFLIEAVDMVDTLNGMLNLISRNNMPC